MLCRRYKASLSHSTDTMTLGLVYKTYFDKKIIQEGQQKGKFTKRTPKHAKYETIQKKKKVWKARVSIPVPLAC